MTDGWRPARAGKARVRPRDGVYDARAPLRRIGEIAFAMFGKKLSIALVVCAALGAAPLLGCVAAPVVPPIGVIYSNFQAPLAPKGEAGSKRGTATVTAILGLVSWGDGSVRQAAANGGITEVKLVDYEFKNVVGVYQRYTTVAYGD